MILTIKAKECRQLPDGSWQLTTNCEDLKEALNAHSVQIVCDYLHERLGIRIEHMKSYKKGGSQ
jgi:hypothetical protein